MHIPWNAKVESQKILGVTGKVGPGVQHEAGQRLTAFCQENALVIANWLGTCSKSSLPMEIRVDPVSLLDHLFIHYSVFYSK